MDISTTDALTRALDYGDLRMKALANNMSNVNTPGYKRRDVEFSSLLTQAENELPMLTSSNGQIDASGVVVQDPTMTVTNTGSMRIDGNNVDIDKETSQLAATEVFYSGAAQLLNNQFAAMKFVISGGK